MQLMLFKEFSPKLTPKEWREYMVKEKVVYEDWDFNLPAGLQ